MIALVCNLKVGGSIPGCSLIHPSECECENVRKHLVRAWEKSTCVNEVHCDLSA